MYIEGNHVFGVMKRNFKSGDRVIIGRTASDLDGLEGRITGKSFENVTDAYIVTLDEPYGEWESISLVEVCLSPL